MLDGVPWHLARRELIGSTLLNVRYCPDSDKVLDRTEMTRWAKTRHSWLHSITSSVTSRDCGMVNPIAIDHLLETGRLLDRHVRRLCTVQYLVGVASSLAEIVGHSGIGHQKTVRPGI
jgi:hypothetical protein